MYPYTSNNVNNVQMYQYYIPFNRQTLSIAKNKNIPRITFNRVIIELFVFPVTNLLLVFQQFIHFSDLMNAIKKRKRESRLPSTFWVAEDNHSVIQACTTVYLVKLFTAR